MVGLDFDLGQGLYSVECDHRLGKVDPAPRVAHHPGTASKHRRALPARGQCLFNRAGCGEQSFHACCHLSYPSEAANFRDAATLLLQLQAPVKS
jgi:hypothetical protein